MKARIVSLIAGLYKIVDLETNALFNSKPRGVLRIKGSSPKVGDIVNYTLLEENNAIIESIEERTNDLIRPSICNIDQALVVFSVKEPDLNLNLLDKFLVTLEYNNIKPIIIFSKWDLLKEEEIAGIEEIINYYSSIGYSTIKTSTESGLIDELKSLIKGHLSCLTGQSGVGKSSLLNALNPSLSLRTNEISTALGRGKHTTRHVELLEINGGWVADTPGFGSLEFFDFDELSLSQNFVDFFAASKNCKYNCCLHLNEPKCAVKDGVENGTILKSRYENYLTFIEDLRRSKK